MNRRDVVLYIGISLDGYIATKDDDLDWLLRTPGEGDNGFGQFYDSVDSIIMGKRTYDWIMKQEKGRFPYVGKQCFVYTTHPDEDNAFVTFTSQNPTDLIEQLRNESGKRIWIVGGAQIIHSFRKYNLIDTYILNVAPVILGDGIPLFYKGDQSELVLSGMRQFGQFVEVSYQVRR